MPGAHSPVAQDQLARALDSSPMACVIVSGPLHNVLFSNRALNTLLGVTSIVGQPLEQAAPQLFDEGLRELLDGVYATGEPVTGRELLLRPQSSADGAPRELCLCWHGHALRNDRGVITGLLLQAADVTGHVQARRSAERQAQENEQAEHQCQALMDSIPDVAWMKDAELRFTRVNRAMVEFTGIPAWDFVGKTDFDVLPHDRALRYQEEDRCVLASGEGLIVEHVEPKLDGTHRIVETIKAPYRDHTGAFAGVAGISRDITERKRAAQKLEASQEHYRLIVEGSEQIFFFLHDDQGIFKYVSPSVAQVLGYTPEQLLGRHYSILLRPESEETAAVHANTIEALTTGNPMPAYVAWTRHRDGHAVCLEITERPLQRENAPITLHGFARDITERFRMEEALRRSEALFRALTEHSTEIICLLHADGTFKYAAPTVKKLLGYEPSELRGCRPHDIAHPEDVAVIEAAHHQLLSEPRSVVSITARVRHRDGSWRYLEGNAQNLLDVPGAEGITINARDVTARVEAAERLIQSQKMEAVGRLAGGVAHDFNNILTAIQGHGELLLDALGEQDPSAAEDVGEILRAAERATRLTRQLLAFSRKQTLQSRILDLGQVVADMRKMLERLIGEHIELSIRCAPDTAHINADPGQVEQVLLNLVVNARDAMPEGGRLTIEVATVADQVALSVTDTGTGIAAQDLPHIFEPFFTTKSVDRGTGLGLATVYGIVQQSGGQVRVTSESGCGSTFTVLLPAVNAALPEEQTEIPPEPNRGEEVVLVVEDEPAVRALVSRVLKREGYQVLEADSGAAALIAAQHVPRIDVLLADVIMPVMNGCALADALLVSHPRCKVLFMSGHDDNMIARYGFADGTHYLRKPFRARELMVMLRRALDDQSVAIS